MNQEKTKNAVKTAITQALASGDQGQSEKGVISPLEEKKMEYIGKIAVVSSKQHIKQHGNRLACFDIVFHAIRYFQFIAGLVTNNPVATPINANYGKCLRYALSPILVGDKDSEKNFVKSVIALIRMGYAIPYGKEPTPDPAGLYNQIKGSLQALAYKLANRMVDYLPPLSDKERSRQHSQIREDCESAYSLAFFTLCQLRLVTLAEYTDKHGKIRQSIDPLSLSIMRRIASSVIRKSHTSGHQITYIDPVTGESKQVTKTVMYLSDNFDNTTTISDTVSSNNRNGYNNREHYRYKEKAGLSPAMILEWVHTIYKILPDSKPDNIAACILHLGYGISQDNTALLIGKNVKTVKRAIHDIRIAISDTLESDIANTALTALQQANITASVARIENENQRQALKKQSRNRFLANFDLKPKKEHWALQSHYDTLYQNEKWYIG